MSERPTEAFVPLRRRLGLPVLALYGTGITVGAGIYVLTGAVAGHAGIFAPWSFVLAAAVMGLTVASYAELSTRFPVICLKDMPRRTLEGSRPPVNYVGGPP